MKKEPWRIFVFVLAVGWIVFMWIRKDLVSVSSGLEFSDAFPAIAVGVVVSLVKVAVLAGIVLLIKWICRKLVGGKT